MEKQFSFGAYLHDHAIYSAIGVGCLVLLSAVLFVLGVGVHAALFVLLVVSSSFICMLLVGYFRRARFYREIGERSGLLGRAYLTAALVEEPTFLEGRIAWGALDASARSAREEASISQGQIKAYRDYIELWIHEIKTPIATAHLIAASWRGSASVKLKGELDRIESYVEQALYYARSTSLSCDYVIREVLLASCVREACRKNARYLIGKGTTPTCKVEDQVAVFADATWLGFILGQVVLNAAKYGASCVSFSTHEEGEGSSNERTILEITDNGQGIPAADMPRIFDRGFTGKNGRDQGSSTGMGLYLVALLCEKMGLSVTIASEEGIGTRVLLAFPHDRRRVNMLAS